MYTIVIFLFTAYKIYTILSFFLWWKLPEIPYIYLDMLENTPEVLDILGKGAAQIKNT